MADSEAPILIAPVAPPLSATASPPSARRRRANARALALALLLAALAAAAAYVFLLLPGRIDAPTAVLAPVVGGPQQRRAGADTPPPFEALTTQQARERAQEHLAAFVATQLRLEQSMNVGAWGSDALQAAKDRAAAGDDLFEDGNYGGAQREYQGAAADLDALVAAGEARYQEALAAGAAALAARDHDAAATAFAAYARALQVRPEDAAASAGRARAEQLPEIIELLREAERTTLRGDHDAAAELLQRAKGLDPATTGIGGLLAANRVARRAATRRAALSRGFRALDAGDLDTALGTFDDVLRQHPEDAAAQAGRQQAEQARTLAAIARLRDAAQEQAEQEQWAAALATSNEALAIDPTLQFARAGRAQASGRLALLAAMARVVADPSLLSADDELAAARRTAREALGQQPAGPQFAARLAELQAVLEAAERPVPLVLMSDNATEVTIQLVGPVGTFERTELALRPGRYVLVGSRDGCRDVRKEILLTANMPPVDIRCAEAI